MSDFLAANPRNYDGFVMWLCPKCGEVRQLPRLSSTTIDLTHRCRAHHFDVLGYVQVWPPNEEAQRAWEAEQNER